MRLSKSKSYEIYQVKLSFQVKREDEQLRKMRGIIPN